MRKFQETIVWKNEKLDSGQQAKDPDETDAQRIPRRQRNKRSENKFGKTREVILAGGNKGAEEAGDRMSRRMQRSYNSKMQEKREQAMKPAVTVKAKGDRGFEESEEPEQTEEPDES